MFSYLLGIMAITIYNQSYGSTGVLNIMNRYDKIMGDAMKNTAFSSMIATIKGLAVGFTIILYLIDLSGKVTEKNFSIEQFFKATLRCVVTYMFIMNSSTIVGYLLDLGGAAAKEVSDQAGLDFFGGNEKSMLINGIAKMKITEILSYIVCSILPWLISMIAEVIIQVVLISRILEIITMTVLSPIAISDIYREGTSSNGVQFMKKMFALGLQVAVILVINTATQAIITQLVGSGYGISITNHLEKSQLDVGMNEGTAISQGKLVYTKESIEAFLDIVTAGTSSLKTFGVTLARIGLIWNSMSLCEEITGAKEGGTKMIEVQVPKDVSVYESPLVGPLTARQTVCVAVAAAIEYVYYNIVQTVAPNIDMNTLICVGMLFAVPVLYLAVGKPYGMKPETYIYYYLLPSLVGNKNRPYETKLTYDAMLELIDEQEELAAEQSGKIKGNKKNDKKNKNAKKKSPRRPRSKQDTMYA